MSFTSVLVIFASVIFAGNSNAAQLVNEFPSALEHNWYVCQHFEAQEATCDKVSLPQSGQKVANNLKYQSYTKDFIVSSELKRFPVGLWIKQIDEVDKVFVNGELIGKTGQFLPNFETGFRRERLYLIPSELLNYNKFNRIEIQTFSSRNQQGIQSSSPVIGNFLEIQKHVHNSEYVYTIVAAILLLLTIFPVFYYIVLKGNAETIHFVFFLLGISIIVMARSELPLNMGLNLSSFFKLETFLLNFSIISLSFFVFKFFQLEYRRVYAIGPYLLGIAGLTVILWPYNIHLRRLAELNYWLVVIITFLVIGSALIIALHKQRKYAAILAVTCAVGWSVIIYDATMQSAGWFGIDLQMRPRMMPIGAALFGIVFTLTMTHRYWDYFKGSTYDHLTGTLLRPAFFQRLSEEMQRSQRGDNMLLVAVIDIQQAKKLSANYGFSIGNHLLSTISNALTKVLRPYDLICRFSDEQFCIAACIKDKEDADKCLQRMYSELINIQQPINEDIELYVDAKIGGVIYNEEQHLSVSHIVQDANYALSKANSQSRQSFLLEQSPLITI